MKNLLKTIFVVALAFLFTETSAQNQTVRDHTRLQNSVSFEARMKSNQAFTLSSAKSSLKQARKDRSDQKKKEREREKLLSIREEIAAIKNEK